LADGMAWGIEKNELLLQLYSKHPPARRVKHCNLFTYCFVRQVCAQCNLFPYFILKESLIFGRLDFPKFGIFPLAGFRRSQFFFRKNGGYEQVCMWGRSILWDYFCVDIARRVP
jgi:hypothetical protein